MKTNTIGIDVLSMGEILTRTRRKMKIKQSQVAKELSVHPSTISRIERNKLASPLLIYQYSMFLKSYKN